MKKKTISCILAVCLASTLFITACSQQEEEVIEEADEANEEVEEEEVDPLTEEDLDGILEGVKDHYVLQDAVDVDYMHGVEYDKTVDMTEEEPTEKDGKEIEEAKTVTKKIIREVKADTSKVDTSTPGTYKITYTVTVNRKAYDAYKAEEAEAKAENKEASNDDVKADEVQADGSKADENVSEDQAEETKTSDDTAVDTAEEAKEDNNAQTDEATDEQKDVSAQTDEGASDENTDEDAEEDDGVDEADLEDVVIEKDIEIVDKEKAEELVESGEEVWTDESKDYGEVLEEEKKAADNAGSSNTDSSKTEEATDNKNDSNESASSSDNSGNSSGGSSGSSSSSGSSGSSGSSSSNSSSGSSSSSSKSTSCDHNWVATYHEATGHYEKVLVSAAYDEKVANGDAYVCNNCGYSTQSSSSILSHCSPPSNCGVEKGTSYSVREQYTTVHHDAVYENKWVQDSAAYTTYKCSKCGATK